MTEQTIAARLQAIQQSIDQSLRQSGRTDHVQLVAVTKTVPVDTICEAFAAGQRVFGENRVQEAARKIHEAQDMMRGAGWHLIGHLQTNKAKTAVELFTLIEAVDSLRLAIELDKRAEEAGRKIPVLFEINVAEEATKSGFTSHQFWHDAEAMLSLPYLEPRGLMTLAPLVEVPEEVRWIFQRLKHMRDEARARYDVSTFTELSMGMSNDYRVAVEEGATIVRLGRALFGERPKYT